MKRGLCVARRWCLHRQRARISTGKKPNNTIIVIPITEPIITATPLEDTPPFESKNRVGLLVVKKCPPNGDRGDNGRLGFGENGILDCVKNGLLVILVETSAPANISGITGQVRSV